MMLTGIFVTVVGVILLFATAANAESNRLVADNQRHHLSMLLLMTFIGTLLFGSGIAMMMVSRS